MNQRTIAVLCVGFLITLTLSTPAFAGDQRAVTYSGEEAQYGTEVGTSEQAQHGTQTDTVDVDKTAENDQFSSEDGSAESDTDVAVIAVILVLLGIFLAFAGLTVVLRKRYADSE